jgi:hypothetical protein
LHKNSFATPVILLLWIFQTFFGDLAKKEENLNYETLLSKIFFDPCPLGKFKMFDRNSTNYNKNEDCLEFSWLDYIEKVLTKSAFCNPPFNSIRYSLELFVEKCQNESEKGYTIFLLLPLHTKNKYFDIIFKKCASFTFLPPLIFSNINGETFDKPLNKSLCLIEFRKVDNSKDFVARQIPWGSEQNVWKFERKN